MRAATLARCEDACAEPDGLQPEVAQEPGLQRAQVHESGERHVVGVPANADARSLGSLTLETLPELDRLVLRRRADQQVAEVPLDGQALAAELLRQLLTVSDVGQIDDDLP